MISRRLFLEYFSAQGLGQTLLPGVLFARVADGEPITTETIAAAEQVAGLSFTEEQRAMMVDDLTERREEYEALRALQLPNEIAPAWAFEPAWHLEPPPPPSAEMAWTPPTGVERPASDEDLAFTTVAELSGLIRSGQVTSAELTELALARLRRYDPVLHCVATLTEARAREQAARADALLAEGTWLGPLHGIPYGAKDLLSTRTYPTTWGAVPYQEQLIDADAAVIEKLEAAGAVLVAKLTLGALAWGDVWFGGMTRNPWNVEQGASGSSAGPGAAVAAGLVPFAIGSETLGSIVSPSTRNGVTGHRPTFGAVSRAGAMTLAWTMDKLGPMARSAEDCALVYSAIKGPTPDDPASREMGFPYTPAADVTRLRVGYLEDVFGTGYTNRYADQRTLDALRGLGLDLIPITLPSDLPVDAMLLTLGVEAAAAFDDLTRSGGTDQMVRQTEDAWPHVFRTARLVPAVEFVQANRARRLLMERMAAVVQEVDVFVAPTYAGGALGITNLTGHPCVCVPNSFEPVEGAGAGSPRRQPGSITFLGGLGRDADVLALATAYQRVTDYHRRRPPIR